MFKHFHSSGLSVLFPLYMEHDVNRYWIVLKEVLMEWKDDEYTVSEIMLFANYRQYTACGYIWLV